MGRGRRAGTTQLCPVAAGSHRHYEGVASWINERHLGARSFTTGCLRYWLPPSPPDRTAATPAARHARDQARLGLRGLASGELGRRANHACVDTIADFRAAPRRSPGLGRSRTRDGTRRTTAGGSTTGGSTCSAGAMSKRSRPRSPTPQHSTIASRRRSATVELARAHESAMSGSIRSPASTSTPPGKTSTGRRS